MTITDAKIERRVRIETIKKDIQRIAEQRREVANEIAALKRIAACLDKEQLALNSERNALLEAALQDRVKP